MAQLLQIAASVIGLDDVDTPARTALLGRYYGVLDNAIVVKWSTRNHQAVIDEGPAVKQEFIRDFVAPSLERRRALIEDLTAGRLRREDLPMDLFTLMLLHPSSGWDGDLMHREAILYLSASIGSSSAGLIFAVDELDRWLLTHPADRALLTDTMFLRRIVNESLRLRATFPAMIRWAAQDTVKSGRRIAEGARVAIVNDAINKDPDVFGTDADQFNPHRVLPPNVHDYGLAFGTGAKSCIAKGLITTARESADAELDRALVKSLKSFHRAGLVVERDRGVERAPTAEVRFTVFPVRFEHL